MIVDSRPIERATTNIEITEAKPIQEAEKKQLIQVPTQVVKPAETRSGGLNWAALRACEGAYTSNTGNGYYGAYQFNLQTWQGVGGTGYPHQASPAEQDMRAQMLYDRRGASPWPVCGKLL